MASFIFNSVFAAAKRHALVLIGAAGTAAVAAVGAYFKDLLAPVQTFLLEKTAEKACQYRQSPISNDSQFIILVSRLKHDPDRSHTDRVMQAFQNEMVFRPSQFVNR
jgi:UDP-N-acetylenolpyruvoylglucosamine reductase